MVGCVSKDGAVSGPRVHAFLASWKSLKAAYPVPTASIGLFATYPAAVHGLAVITHWRPHPGVRRCFEGQSARGVLIPCAGRVSSTTSAGREEPCAIEEVREVQ